jgi:hypothetical protein
MVLFSSSLLDDGEEEEECVDEGDFERVKWRE